GGYARVGLEVPDAVEALLARVLSSDLQPAAVELEFCAEGPWGLWFQFLHVPEAIEWQTRRLAEIAEEADGECEALDTDTGTRVFANLRDRPARAALGARIGTVSSRVAETSAAVVELCAKYGVEPAVHAHAATGQVYLSLAEDDCESGTLLAAARDMRALA